LAEAPARKRAVSGSRSVAADAPRRKGFRSAQVAAAPPEEPPTENYALRLTEALEAISSAQPETPEPAPEPARSATRPLPPIRLPIGPPIPWRIGLPLLLALVVVMAAVSRSSAPADAPGVQLPAQQTYPVQSEAPLFTNAQQAPAPPPQTAQPLGLPESSGPGFDLFDIGIKLVAVLGLVYASLMLLKRAGFGGATPARPGVSPQGMRLVSSLALAPNRTVHVIRVSGGRTLLVGATPNAVNLIADLGDLAETDEPEAATFFDVLKGKL